MALSHRKGGFTLLELVVVVAIVALVALLAVPRVSRLAARARITAAEADLQALREAFLSPEGGYLGDMRGIPGFSTGALRIANLLMATNLYGTAVTAHGLESVRVDGAWRDGAQVAPPEAFVAWDAARDRGWRGPYLRHWTGTYPARADKRFADDTTAAARGFYPELRHLRLSDDFTRTGAGDVSVYGFAGEPAVLDPWGNPYVLQIPPPQAFFAVSNVSDEVRFGYARVVSAGPDGRLDTPCFAVNETNNVYATSWNRRTRRLARQAGRIDGDNIFARGDDLVLFLLRADVDEGEGAE